MAIAFKTGQKIFVDTAPLIYWFEEHPTYIQKLVHFFDEITVETELKDRVNL